VFLSLFYRIIHLYCNIYVENKVEVEVEVEVIMKLVCFKLLISFPTPAAEFPFKEMARSSIAFTWNCVTSTGDYLLKPKEKTVELFKIFVSLMMGFISHHSLRVTIYEEIQTDCKAFCFIQWLDSFSGLLIILKTVA